VGARQVADPADAGLLGLNSLGPVAPSRPRIAVPPGAWDTHFHVLGPQARYPYATTRRYTPPDAPLASALALHDALGIARGLVVHANTHGFDNAVDLDAVGGSGGRYLAVVRLGADATREGCEALHARGARGVRFAFNPQHGGELDRAIFEHVLGCIRGLGWFVELHFEGAALPRLRDWLASIQATVVIDHIGRIDPSLGVEQAPFGVLLELARRDNVWVKLSGADRLTRLPGRYDDVVPFAHRLLEVAPERLVWGSDWPHTGVFDAGRMPDDGVLLDALERLVPDPSLRRRILVDNPERLLNEKGVRTLFP
jgi:predicted TIM-barrel fold metal-dependent hydrolase